MFKDRFRGLAQQYSDVRPSYPSELIAAYEKRAIAAGSGIVLDVGAGTGVSTGLIRGALPQSYCVIGIEPSEDMRRTATANIKADGLEFRGGTAESLDFPDASCCSVVAATAAHWFDRSAFYKEATRVLRPGGILAIVEYVRDEDQSPLAKALVLALTTHSEPRAYARPDYTDELRSLLMLKNIETFHIRKTFDLKPQQFVGLALSSSHSKAWVQRVGRDQAESELVELGERYASPDGTYPFGYKFQLFTASKR